MINWDLLTARNIFAILVMGILAYVIFNKVVFPLLNKEA